MSASPKQRVAAILAVVMAAAVAGLVSALVFRRKNYGPTELLSLLNDIRRWDSASDETRRTVAEEVASQEADFELIRLTRFVCGGQSHEIALFGHSVSGLEFVLIPGGTFTMGSPTNEAGRADDETMHTVVLSEPFLLSRTECTLGAYGMVVGEHPSRHLGENRPVDQISYYDALAFCSRAGLELPTEAQWEYACRGGTSSTYCFGEFADSIDEYAWYWTNSHGSAQPVAQKRPNAFGLYDMHGNVEEWCADFYTSEYPTGATTDPVVRIGGTHPCVRGGSWRIGAYGVRSAVRSQHRPDSASRGLGFRPARNIRRN